MKRHLLPLLALGAALTTAGYVLGQSQPATKGAAAPQQKLVRVVTLNTVEANQEFNHNVQLLQAQRQAVIELNTAHEKETDAKKKQELKTRLDASLAKLNENNAAMTKAYGFSLSRNYTVEIEKANVYMLVSEEEAAKIDAEQKQKAKK